MSERFIVADHSSCVFDKIRKVEHVCADREEAFLLCKRLNEQQATIDKLQRYNDSLHDENLFNTMKMLEFMKEKGVFDEFYERIKKEVFGEKYE